MSRNFICLLILAYSLLPTTCYASSTSTSIHLDSNTGGNTINGNDQDPNIHTGSVTTNLKVQNQGTDSTTHIDVTSDSTSINPGIEKAASAAGNIPGLDASSSTNLQLQTGYQKFELNSKDGHTIITTTDNNGHTTTKEFSSDEGLSINNDGLQLRITGSGSNLTLSQGDIQAHTHLPVTYDQQANQLSLTLDGQEIGITTTPKQAVSQIQDQHLLDTVTKIEITARNGQAVYTLTGTKTKKLFRLIPITLNYHVTLSADSTTSTPTSPLTKLINFLSQ